jgi:hypothetical protein
MVGVGWRCKECSDFDFCFKCFWTAKDTHPGHEFRKRSGADDTEREPQLVDETTDESEDKSSSGHGGSSETSDDD